MSASPDAYTYEADAHCPDCARARFGADAEGFIAIGPDGDPCEDSEGNPVGIVMPWDWDHTDERAGGEHCGTCGAEIVAPWPTESEIDEMTAGYVDAVMFSGYVLVDADDDSERDGGNSPDDLGAEPSESLRDIARMDCDAFLADPENLSILRSTLPWARDMAKAGADFWFTREGHGCGFWERGAGDAGDALADAARAYGEGGCLIINERGEAEFC